MQPDDYTSDNPKWSYWSGKLGWSGFAKSSWGWLDDLYQAAWERQEPLTDTLDVGGWPYDITPADERQRSPGGLRLPGGAAPQLAAEAQAHYETMVSGPSAVYRC